MRISQVEETTYKVLNSNNLARKDNFLLVMEVYKEIQPDIGSMSFVSVMQNHKKMGLPSFETVVRTARKLREKYPFLSDKNMQKIRHEQEREFKAYGLGIDYE